LYPTPEQEIVFKRHCADARFVWNACLEQLNWWRRGGPKGPTNKERSQQLVAARQTIPWLTEGSSTVQHQARFDFEDACSNWWGGIHGRPTWRKRRGSEGFGFQGAKLHSVSHTWALLRIPKAKQVRMRISGSLPPSGCTAVVRITRDGKGRWHASFSIKVPVEERDPTGTAVGIDMGIANTIMNSEGQTLRAPRMSNHHQRKLKRLQRQLARQQRGSARREKTKRQIAALKQTQRDRLKNWREVQTTKLVAANDLIAVEKLPVERMVRRPKPKPDPDWPGKFLPNSAAQKAALNREIQRQGWSAFRRRLEDKAETSGTRVIAVPPQNTSRECNACGHTAAENRKSQAVFACVSCGHEAHADRNAAENILARALAPAPTPGSGARDAVPTRVRRPSNGAARTSRRADADA
jgi:transposase